MFCDKSFLLIEVFKHIEKMGIDPNLEVSLPLAFRLYESKMSPAAKYVQHSYSLCLHITLNVLPVFPSVNHN